MPFHAQGNRFSLAAFRRVLCLIAVVVAFSSLNGFSSTAMACPMCKIAHEDALDPAIAARPKAYMYSILFMLAMPAGLATTFGVTFYRLTKKRQELNEEWLQQNQLLQNEAGDKSSTDS